MRVVLNFYTMAKLFFETLDLGDMEKVLGGQGDVFVG